MRQFDVRLRRKTWRNVRAQGKAVGRYVPVRCLRSPGPGRAASFRRVIRCGPRDRRKQRLRRAERGGRTGGGPPRYVYEAWIGCGGEGFARSVDGGAHFSKPITLPDSSGSDDPAVAVAPDGTVYVSYLRYH